MKGNRLQCNHGMTTNNEKDGSMDGSTLANQGIQYAIWGAGEYFLDLAYTAALVVASDKGRFTSDDVWDKLTEWKHPPEKCKSPSALGAVMRHLHKEGKIRPTGSYESSRVAHRHRRPLRVWEVA
jgi:hypothetical protein